LGESCLLSRLSYHLTKRLHLDQRKLFIFRRQSERVKLPRSQFPGEFDRLVLEANGFPAVTSTGGAATFRLEWADAFSNIPEVYVRFDPIQSAMRAW
jgi:hypothetical protein